MFGQNPIMKNENQNDGSSLRVVLGSPFFTIQGEGPYAGHPAIFIRLHGCHLACTFCDTDFSSPDNPVLSVREIMSRVIQLARLHPGYAHSKTRLVVITGGEPMRQNILPLCQALTNETHTVQIETAGSFWIDGIEKYAHLIVSPKTKTIHNNFYKHAMAFKYVVNTQTDFVAGAPYADTQGRGQVVVLPGPYDSVDGPLIPTYLSPMDEYDDQKNEANRRYVARMCQKFGYIAGLQLHKFLGVD